MVVALFVCRASPYWQLLGDDRCYDFERDARTYAGAEPVIAHPPCRGWGRYKSVAKVQPGELELADFALATVRRCGGVLEHPASSSFWRHAGIFADGFPDEFGGWAMTVSQSDFGHEAQKLTTLYFVGVPRWPSLPPARPGVRSVETMGRQQRERTPLPFARWLVNLFPPVRTSKRMGANG